jgi:hypothetical protein
MVLPKNNHSRTLGLDLRYLTKNWDFQIEGVPLLLFPWKSITLAFERMVAKALVNFGGFL